MQKTADGHWCTKEAFRAYFLYFKENCVIFRKNSGYRNDKSLYRTKDITKVELHKEFKMKQKKEHYTSFSNLFYLMRIMTGIDHFYPVKVCGFIVFRLALPFLASLLPAAAVALITGSSSAWVYLATVGGLALVYGAGQFIASWLDTFSAVREEASRMNYFIMEFYRKSLTMDYCNLEPDKAQLRQNEALESVLDSTWGIQGVLSFGRNAVLNLAGMLLYGSVAATLDPVILLVLAGMVAVHILLHRGLGRFFEKAGEERFRAEEKMNYLSRQAQDAANGKDARVYGMAGWFRDSMQENVKKINHWFIRYFMNEYYVDISDNLFVLVRDLVAYTVLVNRFLAGSISAAEFTLTIGLVATFARWLDQLLKDYSGMKSASFSVDHYRNFMDTEDVMNHGRGADIKKVQTAPEIVFEDVSFTYPGAQKAAIEHLNLTIKAGEKIALVGINGAGKTTLVKLLSGMYLPTSGRILINGVPMEQFNIEEYFKLAATLYQDVNILPCTIGENVACCQEYDREKVLECLDRAGLSDLTDTLPKGLDTSLTQKLDEQGVLLSGGQMQRVLLARALYKNSPILILDEPTAALDPLAEADLYQKYASHVEGKTSIFISHRLSSTQFCHRILFFEQGKILEEGSHRELLEQNGAYAEMFRVQSQYYREEAAHE